MAAYYGRPVRYFTDEISEEQFTMLAECMAEVLKQGEYIAGQDQDKPDLEAFRRHYGNKREVRA
jgi:hypothetical protein